MDEELRTALIDALKKVKEKPTKPWGQIASAANSPFVLTVIGGLALAWVSAGITQRNAENTRERELALAQLRARQEFVQTFSSKLERYFELTLSLRKREMFLKNWQSSDRRATIHYPDGRSFDETRIMWEQERRYWLDQSTESPVGLTNAGRILFKNSAVQNELKKLWRAIEQYGSATTNLELKQAYTRVLSCLEKTSVSMADHIYEKK